MSQVNDEKFYERADEHIHLSNDQFKKVNEEITSEHVSASMMFATARYNAWVSACGFDNPTQMAEARDEMIEYFMTQYRKMLEEHLDDYIKNFNRFMQVETE